VLGRVDEDVGVQSLDSHSDVIHATGCGVPVPPFQSEGLATIQIIRRYDSVDVLTHRHIIIAMNCLMQKLGKHRPSHQCMLARFPK